MQTDLQAFFDKYNNQPINFDGAFGNQCMDLAEQYNKEVVGAPRLFGNAIDAWTNYPKDKYIRVENSPTNFPPPGALVIFQVGKFGHICLVKTADVKSFVSLDQNWPTLGYTDKNGNFIGTGVCHFVTHDYTTYKVLGWLIPIAKKTFVTVTTPYGANIRQQPTTHSPSNGVVPLATKIYFEQWVNGEEVEGNDKWWQLKGQLAYIWSGTTDSIPVDEGQLNAAVLSAPNALPSNIIDNPNLDMDQKKGLLLLHSYKIHYGLPTLQATIEKLTAERPQKLKGLLGFLANLMGTNA